MSCQRGPWNTAVLAFYCCREILISLPCSRVQEVFRLWDFQDRNWGSNMNHFILISLIAGRSMVYDFLVLTSVFSAWTGWTDIGQAKISSSPMRSRCQWLERGRLCHRCGGRGCSGQHSMGNSTNACVDEFSHWRAGLGSSKLSSWAQGEFSPVLHACCTNKAKRQKLLLLRSAPLQMPFVSPLLWVT